MGTSSFRRRARSHAVIFPTLAFVSGCAGNGGTVEPTEAGFGHVHGLGVNPADGYLYMASHEGVFKVADGEAQLIANRRQDTMGFTIAGPDEFLASGHPAPDDDAPNPLGLIRSTDHALTWTAVPLSGEQDFHSVDSVDGRIYAYGGNGQLLSTSDGTMWELIIQADLIDLAANPQSPDVLLATTATGQVISIAQGQSNPELIPAPPLALIDRTTSGTIVGVDPAGLVFVSSDEGTTWKNTASLTEAPQALSTRSETWYIATETGIVESNDEGESWQAIDVR